MRGWHISGWLSVGLGHAADASRRSSCRLFTSAHACCARSASVLQVPLRSDRLTTQNSCTRSLQGERTRTLDNTGWGLARKSSGPLRTFLRYSFGPSQVPHRPALPALGACAFACVPGEGSRHAQNRAGHPSGSPSLLHFAHKPAFLSGPVQQQGACILPPAGQVRPGRG